MGNVTLGALMEKRVPAVPQTEAAAAENISEIKEGQNISGIKEGLAEATAEKHIPEAREDPAEASAEELTEEQLKKVVRIRKNLDLTDPAAFMQYGAGAEREIRKFADVILDRVREDYSSDAGDLLLELLRVVKSMQADQIEDLKEKEGGFTFSLFGSISKSQKRFRQRYEEIETQVSRICTQLDRERMQLIRDIIMLDMLYDKNLEHFRNLQVYIQAGEEAVTDLRSNTVPGLFEEAMKKGDPMSIQVVKDFEDNVNRFEKKIHDLKISKTIAMQTAPQIRLIQNNEKVLADKIQTAVTRTIPLWKNQIALALGLEKQKDILKAEREFTDQTGQILREVNQDLIETIDESIRIEREGHAARMTAEQQLISVEKQLKAKLLRNSA